MHVHVASDQLYPPCPPPPPSPQLTWPQARACGLDGLLSIPVEDMGGHHVYCEHCATSLANVLWKCGGCKADLCTQCVAEARAGEGMGCRGW